MNYKVLYAILLMKMEEDQFVSIQSLANCFNCSFREIIEGLDALSDIRAIKWSLGLDSVLQIELLAELTIN